MFIIVCQCVWIFQENDVSLAKVYVPSTNNIYRVCNIYYLSQVSCYLVDHMSFVLQLCLGTFVKILNCILQIQVM